MQLTAPKGLRVNPARFTQTLLLFVRCPQPVVVVSAMYNVFTCYMITLVR